MRSQKAICVYCGSSRGRSPEHVASARELGTEMVRRGYSLVYGGGATGIMGAVADGVLETGGHAVGVIPRSMVRANLHHHGLTELRIVRTMHERKALMGRLSRAFVALSGGLGTFEELLETLTWVQLGIHVKPVGLLNVNGYFDPLLAMFDRAVEEGFLRSSDRSNLTTSSSVRNLLESLEGQEPPRRPPTHLDWDEV